MAVQRRALLTGTSREEGQVRGVTPCRVETGLAAVDGYDVEVEARSSSVVSEVATRALGLAGRVARNPVDLPQAVATLLDAVVVTDRARLATDASPPLGTEVTTLRIPSPWTAPLLFDRPGRPFTPAESARAHRLAMIAEMTFAAG